MIKHPILHILNITIFLLRKKICCGIIFVGPNREAIVDPRFIEKCHLHKANHSPIMLPKLENPLFTIEKIIESELKNFSDSQKSGEGKASSPGSQAENLGKVPLPAVHNDFDADEGFYDKPSISPTNSID